MGSGHRTVSTLGKWRRLQQAASNRGTFTILAIDHRGPLRRALAKQVNKGEVEAALRTLKQDIVRALAPWASAVLLDPETGVEPCISKGCLPGQTGLLVALDTGSTGDPSILKTGLVPGWDATRVVQVGAAGAKLLVYYHPEAANAKILEKQINNIIMDCDRSDLPLYLEPLSYSLEMPGRSLSSVIRRQAVINSVRNLAGLGADVLKVEFPINVQDEPDQGIWREACAELNEICPIPWVLLSAGVAYELFLQQALIACEAGAYGVIAGRAIWNEAVTMDLSARRSFLEGVASERMARLRSLCDALAKPFYSRCTLAEDPCQTERSKS